MVSLQLEAARLRKQETDQQLLLATEDARRAAAALELDRVRSTMAQAEAVTAQAELQELQTSARVAELNLKRVEAERAQAEVEAKVCGAYVRLSLCVDSTACRQ
jgi:hypothetical protein